MNAMSTPAKRSLPRRIFHGIRNCLAVIGLFFLVYHVLGDDTRDSQDSRFDGPIPTDQIKARAWLIVWPFSRIGFVNP